MNIEPTEHTEDTEDTEDTKGGGGIEFHLSDWTFINGGAAVKTAIVGDRTWVKLYGGVGFRLK